jgi:trans-2,3-dihydro-3-hydroxyanthranilate isomerase
VAAAVSLDVGDLVLDGGGPRSASCGLPFLFVELRDRAALARARLAHDAWQRGLAESWAPDLYLYTRDAERPDSDLRARAFAPAHGVPEDPATGSAAAALAGVLGPQLARDGTLRWTIEQGVEMGRPSLLELEARLVDAKVVEVRVAGASTLVSEGRMEVPEP